MMMLGLMRRARLWLKNRHWPSRSALVVPIALGCFVAGGVMVGAGVMLLAGMAAALVFWGVCLMALGLLELL